MQIAAAVEKAGAQTDQQIKALLQQKAEEVMSKIDLSRALSLGGSPEEAVKHAMEEASAQLQAEGANFRLAQAEPQAPPSSNMQVISSISICLDSCLCCCQCNTALTNVEIADADLLMLTRCTNLQLTAFITSAEAACTMHYVLLCITTDCMCTIVLLTVRAAGHRAHLPSQRL